MKVINPLMRTWISLRDLFLGLIGNINSFNREYCSFLLLLERTVNTFTKICNCSAVITSFKLELALNHAKTFLNQFFYL